MARKAVQTVFFFFKYMACLASKIVPGEKHFRLHCNFHPDLEALPKYHSTVLLMIVNCFKEKVSREHTKYVSTSLNPLLYRTP